MSTFKLQDKSVRLNGNENVFVQMTRQKCTFKLQLYIWMERQKCSFKWQDKCVRLIGKTIVHV